MIAFVRDCRYSSPNWCHNCFHFFLTKLGKTTQDTRLHQQWRVDDKTTAFVAFHSYILHNSNALLPQPCHYTAQYWTAYHTLIDLTRKRIESLILIFFEVYLLWSLSQQKVSLNPFPPKGQQISEWIYEAIVYSKICCPV